MYGVYIYTHIYYIFTIKINQMYSTANIPYMVPMGYVNLNGANSEQEAGWKDEEVRCLAAKLAVLDLSQ